MSDGPGTTPPAGEEIHLPGPSIKPLLVAVGLTLLLLGLTTLWPLSIIGLVLLVWVIVAWIADTRRDMGELPVEH